MRMSDWSPDVCSSDLHRRDPRLRRDDGKKSVARAAVRLLTNAPCRAAAEMPCGGAMKTTRFHAAIAAVALLSFAPAVSAAPAKGDAPVTEAEPAAHIKILADDAFEGRAPGTEGEEDREGTRL